MHLAARYRQASKRAGIVSRRLLYLQETFAHGGNSAQIRNSLALDGAQDFLRIKMRMHQHGGAEIEHRDRIRPAVIEIDRRGKKRPIMNTEPLFDRIVD